MTDETIGLEKPTHEESAMRAYQAGMSGWTDPLSPDVLLALAENLTGLSDWGGQRWDEDEFRHSFTLLCNGIEETGEVSGQGRQRSFARLLTILVSRLRYLDARKRTSGVEEQRVLAPLIGTGMPRAGTTFLHGVIAQDPDLRVARAFEAAMPVPLPGQHGDRRAQVYDALLSYQGMTDPELRAMHPYGAELPEECLFLQEGACTAFFGGFWNVPAFMAAAADKTALAYKWQIGVMQYLQADGDKRRWALKTPAHIMAWHEMRLAFPDALIYVNHRDPAKVVPSMTSLLVTLRGLYSDQAIDRAAAGREQVAVWAQAMNDYGAWRRGPGQRAQVVDINFSDLTADPLTVIANLYDSFGLTLSALARERMERHLATDHHGKGPQRRYSLAEFGMTADDIDAAFGEYIDQFGITRERGGRT